MSDYTATLRNGTNVPVADVLNGWQAFFCANMNYPGQVKKVCLDSDAELPEIEGQV